MDISLTYTIATPESSIDGQYAEQGFIAKPGELSLRECIELLFRTRTNEVDGIAHQGVCEGARYEVQNNMEYRTCANETRSLRVDGITDASWCRLCYLLDAC